MNIINNARMYLIGACASKDESRIMKWLRHHVEFFPPIVYENAELIYSQLTSLDNKKGFT